MKHIKQKPFLARERVRVSRAAWATYFLLASLFIWLLLVVCLRASIFFIFFTLFFLSYDKFKLWLRFCIVTFFLNFFFSDLNIDIDFYFYIYIYICYILLLFNISFIMYLDYIFFFNERHLDAFFSVIFSFFKYYCITRFAINIYHILTLDFECLYSIIIICVILFLLNVFFLKFNYFRLCFMILYCLWYSSESDEYIVF